MKTPLIILFSIFSFKTIAQQKTAVDSVHFLLDTTISIMQKKGLYAGGIKWDKLSQELKEQTANVKTVKDAAFAFTRLYDELNDVHGAFFYIDTAFRSSKKIKNLHKINEATNAEVVKGPKVVSKMLTNDIAYIRIPVITAQDSVKVIAMANRINDSIIIMLAKNPKGLIVDLRLNQGGNMFPMVGGLRSLFQEGIISDSYYYDSTIYNKPLAFKKDSLLNGYFQFGLNQYKDFHTTPVAVLIGPSTASAGECTAASLTYRKNSILIGEETMGLTHGNDGFMIIRPSIGFNLAVGVLKNGKGELLYEVIKPEITVEGGDNFTNLLEDKKVQRAIQWVRKKK